jgi:uncharacterized protein YqeY
MQILALLKKRKTSTQDAIMDAKRAQRPDLVEKSEKEISIIEEYTSSIQLMEPKEIRMIVRKEIETMRASSQEELKPGLLMKHLLQENGGALHGKPLDKKIVAELVREELVSNHGTQ